MNIRNNSEDKMIYKIRIKKLFIAIFIVLLTVSLSAKIPKDGSKYGFQFLKIPVSPELAAMANTGEAIHSSPLTFFHHPVAHSWQRGASVGISQTNWFFETNMYNLAYRNTGFKSSFGFGLVYMDYGQFDKRDYKGSLEGSFYPMDLRFTTNIARKLSPDIHLGVNFNMLYQKIHTASAYAFTTDFGLQYLTPFRNTSLDFAIKNIGDSSKMDLEKIEIPIIVDFGVATALDITDTFILKPALKISYIDGHDDIMPALGVQGVISDMLFLRVGYKFNYNEEDFSTGFGIHWNQFRVDYTFIRNAELEHIHIFGIGMRF